MKDGLEQSGNPGNRDRAGNHGNRDRGGNHGNTGRGVVTMVLI